MEALETEHAAPPPPTPQPTVTLQPLTQAQVEDIVSTQLTARIIPYAERYIEKAATALTKIITEAADATLRLLTERFSALESTLPLEHPPQAPKQKVQIDL